MNVEHESDADVPEASTDDVTKPTDEAHMRAIADTPAGRLLQSFVLAANGIGDEAEEVFKSTLRDLRSNSGTVVAEIARSLGCAPEHDYPLRWTLVYAAAELRSPVALPLLKSIILTPIPPEKSTDPHSFSSVAEETILRTTAVDGVAALAGEKVEEAAESLFEFLELPSTSIQRAAVQGLKTLDSGKEFLERIEECLPKHQRYLVHLRPMTVKNVGQIKDPRVHLSCPDRVDKAGPPSFDSGEARRNPKEEDDGTPDCGSA